MEEKITTKHYEWLILPQAYFLSAKILCNSLIEEMRKNEYGSGQFRKKHLYRNSVEYSIFPIVYNFKHGLELYLKGVGDICTKTYPINHDLIDLLNILIKKIDRRIPTTAREDVLEKLDKIVRAIIEKYYFGLYIPSTKSKALPDKMNIAERYPESHKAQTYEIPDLFQFENNKKEVACWVTEELLNKIKKDMKDAYNIFEQIAPSIAFERA